ncbi:methyltransferase [Candidatus Woesearchaeota archaeon]|nr:methyltransferase [Candidatus Woesearchaeota archaeon]
MVVYEPREDSFLLEKFVRKYAFGRVLDMGTGSGILALSAMKSPNVREVIAVDINEEAVESLKDKLSVEKIRKVKVLQSDLFENVEGQFHLILFNPPYLPQDTIGGQIIEDAALYGGKKGWEIAERFFADASTFLFADGKILFLFSSLTNKKKIEEIISHTLFDFKEIGKEKLAFEELYVYEVSKSPLLRELEARGVSGINYLAKGKRGLVYTGDYDTIVKIKKFLPLSSNKVKVAIKVKRQDSMVSGNIVNEAKWLEKLNGIGIGPRFLFSGGNYFVYEFVEGEEIIDSIKKKESNAIKKVLIEVLRQCWVMDCLKVNKEEMHHPVKHILINKLNIPIMIDFERCRETDKPRNVTQFLEFIGRFKELLIMKGLKVDVEKLRELAKKYKESYTKGDFEELLSVFV